MNEIEKRILGCAALAAISVSIEEIRHIRPNSWLQRTLLGRKKYRTQIFVPDFSEHPDYIALESLFNKGLLEKTQIETSSQRSQSGEKQDLILELRINKTVYKITQEGRKMLKTLPPQEEKIIKLEDFKK